MVYLNAQRSAAKSPPAASLNGQNSCRRCGTCCSQGGPALHRRDLELVGSGRIPLDRLITVRRGELAHNPLTGRVQAVRAELVKIAGTGGDWRCSYYDADNRGCGIYGHRPQACEVLQCWDTEAILALVEKDLLSRLDIVDPAGPMARLISEHEERCPCPPGLEGLADRLQDMARAEQVGLEQLVSADLMVREQVVREYGLSLQQEMFYFGRPIFHLLQPFGIRVGRLGKGFVLHWPVKK
jgi:Fe-S-cluster containining protein